MGENKKTLNSGSLTKIVGFFIEFIMKLPSLVTLMSSIVFNDSLGMENIFIGFLNKSVRSGESTDSKTMFIRPSKCKLCYFEQTCTPLGCTPLLPLLKCIKCVYQVNSVYSILS